MNPLKELSGKAKEIFDGWENYIFKEPKIEELAKVRASICAVCPHSEKSIYVAFIIETAENKEVEGHICGLCRCPLSGLVRSVNSKCEKDNW